MSNTSKFERLLAACFLTPQKNPHDPLTMWGITPNFIGSSGAGKSAAITSVARHVGLPCYPIFSATKTPEHIGGFPANTPEGFMLKCALPQVLSAIDAQSAVIFLDEISTAPEAVQAALLSFVNERTVGEYVLPTKCRIAMAMNPPDVAANGHDLAIPMANRIAHFEFTPWTLEQFESYKLGRYKPAVIGVQDGEQQVKDNWNDHYAHVVALCCDFLRAANGQVVVKDSEGNDHRRSKFSDQPDPTDSRAGGPWPSHRTWDWAMNAVTTIRCLGFEPALETDMVAALVGKGIASEWATYIRKMDLPQPEEILTSGAPVPRRIDMARATLDSCATYVTGITDPEKQAVMAVACWRLLGQAIKNQGYADISVPPARQLIHASLDISHDDERVQDAAEDVCSWISDSGQLRFL